MDEIIRAWMLTEKQPEDQGLWLSSIMGFIEQKVPKRRLRGSKQFGWNGSSLVKHMQWGQLVGKVWILSLQSFLPVQWFSISSVVPFYQIPLVFLIPDNNCSSSQSMGSWLAASAPASAGEDGLLKIEIVDSALDLQVMDSEGWSPESCVLVNFSGASGAGWSLRIIDLGKRAVKMKSMKDNRWGYYIIPFWGIYIKPNK